MAFSLSFLDEKVSKDWDSSGEMRLGLIVIGDFEEHFEASLSYWSVEDYRRQWKQALERVKTGETKSSLITRMYDPQTANLIVWWPLYREGQQVYIHNSFLLMDALNEPFDPLAPYKHVADRRTIGEDGGRISEWETTITEIEEFLATL